MRKIEIRDEGPIERLEIVVPDEGGVVVLRGRNGAGKSHALGAVGALCGSGQKLATRDGTLGAVVEGLGVRLTMGRRTSASGELECEALSGEDPSLLVDPGLKDAEAADAARIRALLRLAHAEVPIEAFAELVGGEEQLRKLCRESSLEGRDVPSMASSIKRDLESAARSAEKEAIALSAKAEAAKEAMDKLGDAGDLSTKSSLEARELHENAVRSAAQLRESARSNERMLEAAGGARGSLEAMGAHGTQAAIDAAGKLRSELNAQVEEQRAALERTRAELAAADDLVAQERRQAAQRTQLERTVHAAADARLIRADELEAADAKVDLTRAEVAGWTVLDRAAGFDREVSRLIEDSRVAQEHARMLRAAAQGTERVLLEAVRKVVGDAFTIQDGRVYIKTDRGQELFSELSDGERYRIALDVSVRALGPGALLVMRQEAWEGLDPANRKAVSELARERRVALLTAECDAGDLRAEAVQ